MTLDRNLAEILNYSLCAPSVHNTQPWKFEVRAGGFRVHRDQSRALQYADPTGREYAMSLGTFLETVRCVARATGHTASFSVPQNDGPVEVMITHGPNPIIEEQRNLVGVLERRSNRFFFDPDRSIESSVYDKLSSVPADDGVEVVWIEEMTTRKRVAHVLERAIYETFSDKKFCAELAHWLPHNWTSRRDGMPGYVNATPLLISFLRPFALHHLDVRPRHSKEAFKQYLEAPLLAVIAVGRDEFPDWVRAGVALQKLWVTATLLGLQVSVTAATTEIDEYRQELKSTARLAGLPMLVMRFGYCKIIPPHSPRRPIEDFILASSS